MKDIGESFREARDKIGLSKEEVIKDLDITPQQLDNLEDGNVNAFKDVFFLKELIKKYAIYLNLNEDDITSTFNDFIFGYTSRIPVEEILEQTREIKILEKKQNVDKVSSPYTKIKKEKKVNKIWLMVIAIVIVSVLLVSSIIIYFNSKSETLNNNYIEERSI